MNVDPEPTPYHTDASTCRFTPRARFAILLLLLWGVTGAGCSRNAPAHPGQVEGEQASPGSVEELGQHGQQTAAGGRAPRPATDFDVESPALPAPVEGANGNGYNPGMIGGLRNFIQSFDFGADEETQGGLLQQLDDASVSFQEIRKNNRDAIRMANRQVRTGRSGSSPNIILIQLERLSPDDLTKNQLEGHPHLSAFVAQGRRFTRHYAASPVLSLARWSLLTGKSPVSIPPSSGPVKLPATPQTLPNLLWDGGYSTGFIGQWDSPEHPLNSGYEEWIGFLRRDDAAAYPLKVRIDQSEMELIANKPESDAEKRVHALDLFASEAGNFLARNRNSNRPFFLHVSFPYLDSNENTPSLHDQLTPRIDAAIGKIVSALEHTQMTRTTCVIVTAESGPALRPGSELPQSLPNGTRIFPHGMGEGNLHIPLVVSWPGQVLPGETDHLSATWDLLPTLLELTSTRKRPAQLSGISFASLLKQKDQSPKSHKEHPLLYWATPDRAVQTVRKGNWKGLLVRGETAVRLYDLSTDPGETNDVASSSPEIVRQLMAK